jgi:NTP pyrophosphatase (non-canonical NTP hydrolase)
LKEEMKMEFREYQLRAQLTDQLPSDVVIPLLGLSGEVGSLLSEYKKFLRDGPAHELFPEKIAEELGDVLWYLANAATKFELNLDNVATSNIEKTQDRWPPEGSQPPYSFFDESFGPDEQLPRSFTAEINEEVDADGKARIHLLIDGHSAGDPLRDNSYAEDGYRFHDVFHLAHAAKLGWSPVLRGKLLDPSRKRRSEPEVNEVEDGGRAIVIDEAIVAYVWEYARRHNFLDGVTSVDYRILKTIKDLTDGLEVRERTAHQWEEAILAGYAVWRGVNERRSGRIEVDLRARRIQLVN